jgi:phosphohistidine phosphatase
MSIEIYLVRHGLAGQFGDYEDDAVRPLTDDGVKKTHKVAKRLVELGLSFDRILTSPYQRAYQTAQILQEEGLSHSIDPLDSLQPGGDQAITIESVTQIRSEGLRVAMRLAIVGHEPDLSQLAATLILGHTCENLTLKKAGIIGLTAPIEGELIGQCQLFWLTPPRLFLT